MVFAFLIFLVVENVLIPPLSSNRMKDDIVFVGSFLLFDAYNDLFFRRERWSFFQEDLVWH